MTLKGTIKNGTIVLDEPAGLPEGTRVELALQKPLLLMPLVSDLAEKTRILSAVVQRMRGNPVPAAAPRLSRDDLHERR